MVYYNDHDPFVCEWTANLIRDGHLPEGTVDERGIEEIEAKDLNGHVWCSFFNGLGGWIHALRLAGFDPARPVWCASLPCQPYSVAGRQEGENDPRDLWPHFHRLVCEYRPATILGEQVDGAVGLGWLDRVFADLEAEGYACAAAVLPAACVGAPHIRHRLFWVARLVADARQPPARKPRKRRVAGETRRGEPVVGQREEAIESGRCGEIGGVADAGRAGLRIRRQSLGREAGGDQGEEDQRQRLRPDTGDGIATVDVGDTAGGGLSGSSERVGSDPTPSGVGSGESAGTGRDSDGTSGVAQGNTCGKGPQGRQSVTGYAGSQLQATERAGDELRPWDDSIVIPCRDGKARRISPEPSAFPLADGLQRDLGPFITWMASMGYDSQAARQLLRENARNRTGRLRGYGNAIVPQVAAEFVRAFLDAEGD